MKAQCVVPEDIHTSPFSVWIPAPTPPSPTHTHTYTARRNSTLIPVWLHTFTWKMFPFVTSPPCNSNYCTCNYEVVMDILWNHMLNMMGTLHTPQGVIQQSTRITVLVVFSLVVCSWEGWCYLLSIIFSLKLKNGKIWKSA